MNECDQEIIYPDSLVNMWKFAHNIPMENFSEVHYQNCWKILTADLKKSKNFSDNVYDYLIDLLNGPCPDYIVKEEIFWKNYKKFKAQRLNPEQYELNSILHKALRELEKAQLIKRAPEYVNKIIKPQTLFVLSSIKNPRKVTKVDYERNNAQVPHFSPSKRGNTFDNSRIISLKNAQQLVLALLTAFGGWTTKKDLLDEFKNHIPPLLAFSSLSDPIGNDDSDKAVEHDALDTDSDAYIYENDYRKIKLEVQEISSHIWTRIAQISDKVFCLYSLPKLQEKKVSMKDVGATSTVGDQHNRILKVLQEELIDLKEKKSSVLRQNQAVDETVKRITEKLQQSCTEFGWI